MPDFNASDLLRVGSLNFLHNPDNFHARIPSMVKAVREANLDVLCFQEFMPDFKDDIDAVLEPLGFVYSFTGGTLTTKRGVPHGTAIYSRVPVEEFINLPSTSAEEQGIPFAVAQLSHQGRPVHILTGHFMWGSFKQGARLRQAQAAARYAASVREQHPEAVVLLTGDLNAVPDSSPIRFLKGLQEAPDGSGSLWVDAWEACGADSSKAITSIATGFWGRVTAAQVGIQFPEMVPSRRIDYIFSYEWAYGKPGAPVSFELFANETTGDETEVSDHYGIYADIYVPSLDGYHV